MLSIGSIGVGKSISVVEANRRTRRLGETRMMSLKWKNERQGLASASSETSTTIIRCERTMASTTTSLEQNELSVKRR